MVDGGAKSLILKVFLYQLVILGAKAIVKHEAKYNAEREANDNAELGAKGNAEVGGKDGV